MSKYNIGGISLFYATTCNTTDSRKHEQKGHQRSYLYPITLLYFGYLLFWEVIKHLLSSVPVQLIYFDAVTACNYDLFTIRFNESLETWVSIIKNWVLNAHCFDL